MKGITCLHRRRRLAAVAAAVLCVAAGGAAAAQEDAVVRSQSSAPAPADRVQGQPNDPALQACELSETYLDPRVESAEPLDPQRLSSGWLAGNLIGQTVYGSDGDELGEVSDILVNSDSRIVGVTVERGGFLGLGDAPFRIDWDIVDLTENVPGIAAAMSSAEAEQMVRYTRPRGVEADGGDFRVSELIGDWTRIGNRTTLCYEQRGHVADVVFDDTGALFGIIEERSEDIGGGHFAYPFYAHQLGWRPFYGYYDLPLENMSQAPQQVNLESFENNPATAADTG